MRADSGTETPWPFRIDAHTGKVINGEEYGGMIVAPVRLFDELLRLGEGDSPSYQRARDVAWKWLLDNPLNTASVAWDNWSGYYEDTPKDIENQNDMTSIMTCYYILSQTDPSVVDPGWRNHIGHLKAGSCWGEGLSLVHGQSTSSCDPGARSSVCRVGAVAHERG
jgi:hypothetical protein